MALRIVAAQQRFKSLRKDEACRQRKWSSYVTYLVGYLVVVVVMMSGVRRVEAEENFSTRVYPGEGGKLINVPDEQGNVIQDFSHCGYMGGGVALPEVPVVMTVWPEDGGDEKERLQAVIDAVSERVPDTDGFCGALLLRRGTYRIGGTLKVRTSAVG